MKSIIQVEQLSVTFKQQQGELQALDRIAFTVDAGETLAIVGESGSGKSLTALAMMQLLPLHATLDPCSRIVLGEQDLLTLSEVQMRQIRGKRMAMIFQEPMTALNPVFTVGEQISECLRQHQKLTHKACLERVCDLFEAVGISAPKTRFQSYPHQLSGGLKQRVMIAMALALEPDVLIADEPTTALDVTIQAQILDLLKSLQQQYHMALVLITHDLGVVRQTADRIAVMYAGQIIETTATLDFFTTPQHPYSQSLLATIPHATKRHQCLTVIPGQVPILGQSNQACHFADRCQHAWPLCHKGQPRFIESTQGHWVRCHLYDERARIDSITQSDYPKTNSIRNEQHLMMSALLSVQKLKVHFPIHKGLLQRTKYWVRAVDEVNLEVSPGQTLAIVGESGCGKTTLAKTLVGLIKPIAGRIDWQSKPLDTLTKEERTRAIQMIFQDPFAALNPRMMIMDIITEGLTAMPQAERVATAKKLLNHVGLNETMLHRYPHQLSGGQRQRLGIARALAMTPKLIVCDEPTSALDVSVQAQVLNLLKAIQQKRNMAYVFISHDMAVVSYMADHIAVMYLGRIVEYADSETLLNCPKHPYTQALLAAVPKIDQNNVKQRLIIHGEQPSPIHPPQGCHFHTRCPHAMLQCKQTYPKRTQLNEQHHVYCYLYKDFASESE